MARLILDAMGGDYAPRAILEGASKALSDLARLDPQGELVLVGDENAIRPLLEKRKYRELGKALGRTGGYRVSIQHATQNIEMEDSIRAIRNKPNATINIGCSMASKAYKARRADVLSEPATAFISAGHSGAVMASALLNMGRLRGIERPAIAIKLPTLSPNGCVLLDVGANVDCKPEHLRDFALMGAIFASAERKTGDLPKIGVLSNGEERSKGCELTRGALELIDQIPCFTPTSNLPENKGVQSIGNFVGYVEGKEIFKGQVDAVVTDGFVGNVVLKSLEGLGSAVVTTMKKEARHSLLTPIGFLLAAATFARLKRKLDYAEYGAAPLLGVAGYAFICHGRSNPRAIKNALLRAFGSVQSAYVERLEQALETTHRKDLPQGAAGG
jgi:glycerol-3-phosphate acyltransferase PlsX